MLLRRVSGQVSARKVSGKSDWIAGPTVTWIASSLRVRIGYGRVRTNLTGDPI